MALQNNTTTKLQTALADKNMAQDLIQNINNVNPLSYSNGTPNAVTATGTTAASAAPLSSAPLQLVTTPTANYGVILPLITGTLNLTLDLGVANMSSNALLVYPQTGYSINGTANNGKTVPANSNATFFGDGAGNWRAIVSS